MLVAIRQHYNCVLKEAEEVAMVQNVGGVRGEELESVERISVAFELSRMLRYY